MKNDQLKFPPYPMSIDALMSWTFEHNYRYYLGIYDRLNLDTGFLRKTDPYDGQIHNLIDQDITTGVYDAYIINEEYLDSGIF